MALTINQSQIDSMAQQAAIEREVSLTSQLSATLKARPEALVEPIRKGISLAAQCGIHNDSDIASLIQLLWDAARQGVPDNLPKPVLAILLSHGEPPAAKLQRLQQWSDSSASSPPPSLAPLPQSVTVNSGAPAIQPCPLSRTHWLEIEMLDELDKPVPWLAYRVHLPDGTEVNGYLDGEGYARFAGLAQPGSCRVCFPELDKDAWQPIDSVGPRSG